MPSTGVLTPKQRQTASEITARINDLSRDVEVLRAIEYDVEEDAARVEHLRRLIDNLARVDAKYQGV